jgi:uncharacterized protein YigE (DUF2233 family)
MVVFILTKTKADVVTTNDYNRYKKDVLYATQSGPMLLINSTVNSIFTQGSVNIYIRSGVGISKDGRLYLLYLKML